MIWLLVNGSNKRLWDQEQFIKSAKKLEIPLHVVDKNKISLYMRKNEINYSVDGERFNLPTLIINWLGSSLSEYDQYLFHYFASKDIKVINNYEDTMLFKHKFSLLLKLSQAGVKIPFSYKLSPIDLINNNDSHNYPLIVKSDWGSYGMGVLLINDNHQLKMQLETFSLLDSDYKFFFQEYIKTNYELRIYVIGKKYYAIKKHSTKGEFRANLEKNAIFEMHNLTKIEQTIIEAIISELEIPLMGIDLLVSDDDVYVCEINSAPGFLAFYKFLNIDISYELLKYYKGVYFEK